MSVKLHWENIYLAHLRRTLKPTGSVIVGTFGPDCPAMCSRLPVTRYTASQLAEEFAPDFTLVDEQQDSHRTPSGAMQTFSWARFTRAKRERADVAVV